MAGQGRKRQRRAGGFAGIRLGLDGKIWTPRSTKRAPKPLYLSFDHYRSCMTSAELRKKFNRRPKKANGKRLFSDAPKERLSGSDVWEIFAAAFAEAEVYIRNRDKRRASERAVALMDIARAARAVS